MINYKSFSKTFLSFLMSLILASIVANPVFACTPPPPTPWFIENVSILSTNLPESINITSNSYSVTLRNNTEVPVSIEILDGDRFEEFSSDKIIFSSQNNVLSANEYYVKGLGQSNVIADNRPANVTLPQPQDVAVNIKASDQSYVLNLRISYEINNGYNPHSVEQNRNACQSYFYSVSFPYHLVLVAVGVVILTLLAIPILKKLYPPD